jgi:hypothetical protein
MRQKSRKHIPFFFLSTRLVLVRVEVFSLGIVVVIDCKEELLEAVNKVGKSKTSVSDGKENAEDEIKSRGKVEELMLECALEAEWCACLEGARGRKSSNNTRKQMAHPELT